jgi:hypothetical protein
LRAAAARERELEKGSGVAERARARGEVPALSTILDESRGYIRDFRASVAASSTSAEVIQTMKTKYPDYGPVWSFSAPW